MKSRLFVATAALSALSAIAMAAAAPFQWF